MALFCSAIRRESVSFLWISFLRHVQVFSCEISLVCRLKCQYNCCFFPLFLFSCYFCSVDAFFVCIVSCRSNRFLCNLPVVVSMYRRNLVGCRILIFLFLTHAVSQRYLCDVRPYTPSLLLLLLLSLLLLLLLLLFTP